ncbi:MAG: GGDEF domain-containing protein, partial [bacterium]
MTTNRFPGYLRILGPTMSLVHASEANVIPMPSRDIDRVSGVATRDALLARLETIGELAPNAPLSFLVVKVAGLALAVQDDQVRLVAGTIRELTRGVDVVGRLAEDVFGIALQGTGVVAAGAVAARLTHHLNRLAELSPSICISVSAATGTGLNAGTLAMAAMDTCEPCCG